MSAMASQYTPFGTKVRRILNENKVAGRKPDSIRSLARCIGNGDAVRSETAKRSLHKWFVGKPNPTPTSRYVVASALGVDPAELGDDEEEESDQAMRRAFDLFVDLMGELTARQQRTTVSA